MHDIEYGYVDPLRCKVCGAERRTGFATQPAFEAAQASASCCRRFAVPQVQPEFSLRILDEVSYAKQNRTIAAIQVSLLHTRRRVAAHLARVHEHGSVCRADQILT